MKVTTIINGHREGRLLAASLRSAEEAIRAAGLDAESSEVLLVLDRPDEITLEVARYSQLPGLTLVEVDFGDLGASRSAGIERASGTHIALLDGDDIWGSKWLRRSIEFTQAHPGSILHPQLIVTFPENVNGWQSPDMLTSAFHLTELLIENCWTSLAFAPATIFQQFPYRTTEDASKFGYEDWAWNCDTIAAGVTHSIVPKTVHFIRKRATSLSMKSWNGRALTIPHTLTPQRVIELSGGTLV